MTKTQSIAIIPYKFEQIRDKIISEIETGVYLSQHQLPTSNKLCQTYGFSKVTVTRALLHLKKRGYIFYIPGKGHYVL